MDQYILHIDTASSLGLVMLSKEGKPVAVRTNPNPMSHASFVQPAIAELMAETGVERSQIKAVALANGPGSYTGLRVGLASAKGLCFVWGVPLITVSSLKIMAAAIQQYGTNEDRKGDQAILLVPMIDARRMEVFFSVYHNFNLQLVSGPSTAIIDPFFMQDLLQNNIIYFTGNGADKWQEVCQSPQARFVELPNAEMVFGQLAFQACNQGEFADIAYAEPFYAKEFYSPLKKVN